MGSTAEVGALFAMGIKEAGAAASRLAPLACPCLNALGGVPFSRLCPRRLANRFTDAPNPLSLGLLCGMASSTNFGCAGKYAEAMEFVVLDEAGFWGVAGMGAVTAGAFLTVRPVNV
jgi:hypothetical protein